MIKHLPQYVSVTHYADLCGVQNRTVYLRAANKTIKFGYIGKHRFVDLLAHPPVKHYKKQRFSTPKNVADLIDVTNLSPLPSLQGMISVKEFAEKKTMRSDTIYELILSNKLNAWVIGDLACIYEEEFYKLTSSVNRK
jgi:hypothetical protein